ncbi:MAG: nucleoside hydrolase [Candidatus Binatia bacterium]
MPRIVLDTDIGSDCDDSVALALALASPEIELAAVTIVSGEVGRRGRIAAHLLALGGRPDVPVHPGCARPLGPGAFVWFGHEGIELDGARGLGRPSDEPAVDALLRLFDGRRDLELVTIGPLTNVAAALRRDPGLARRVPRLTIMGGFLSGAAPDGRPLPQAIDYNLCGDPEAAAAVFAAGWPIRLVSIDVTLQVWLDERDAAALAAAGLLGAAVARALRAWAPIQRDGFAGLGAPVPAGAVSFLHDPLALACAHDESFCTFADLDLLPSRADGLFRLVRGAPGAAGAVHVRVATAVDAPRFVAHVRRRLGIAA